MLAEKWRPIDFGQVIGQGKTVNLLSFCLKMETPTGKVFLLTGPTGSGKTTLALCAARWWGVADQDIQLIKSADGDISALRAMADSWCYYGSKGKRAYILDEIHTLGARAADYCLSLFERIPSHVVIFGTTTEEKWCDGILGSRFTKLRLQKVNSAQVAAHLERVAAAEGLPIPADAAWATKMVKQCGLNIRELLNQLPERLLDGDEPAEPMPPAGKPPLTLVA